MSGLSVDPQHLAHAVGKLDAIAAGLERTVGEHRAALTVAPAGSDEVSVGAAKSFSQTAELFGEEIVKGVSAIRDVAAGLREQTSTVTSTDEAIASDLTAL